MIGTILIRDLRLALRHKTSWIIGPVFYLLFLTMCAIAVPSEIRSDPNVASALIWLAALFSLMLSFPSVFAADYEDGTMEALILTGIPKTAIILAKAILLILLIFTPLLIATPLAGLAFGLAGELTSAIVMTIIISAPALIAYGLLAGALLGRSRGAGVLAILITTPFILPVLIFALSAASQFAESGLSGVEFTALMGINLIAIAIGLPATAAALSANLE